MGSSTSFADLNLTPEDYVEEPNGPHPAYRVLRDGLYEKLSSAFNELVAAKFSTDEWTISSGYALWDNEKTEPLVVVTPKLTPDTSFMMNHHVPKRISGGDTVHVTARILRYDKGKYNGILMDDLLSGTGNYNPEFWAEDAYDATRTYVFHGVLPSGW